MCNDAEAQKDSVEEICVKSNFKKLRNNEILKNQRFDEVEELTLEDLAPDGGWGWMVLLGMIVVTTTMFSTAPSIPILFSEVFEASGQPALSMTILASVWTLSWSISALFTNVLLKKYSMRCLGISGALLFAMTQILSSLVTHVYQLTIMFSLQGLGIGIMSTICQANFNAYFVKKRVTLNSAAQIIISVGGTIYPILIGILMETYGFRGTAAIIGALNLHSVFGMLLMHPVQWHLRDPQEVHEERRKLLQKKLVENKCAPDTKFEKDRTKDQNMTVHDKETILDVTRCSSLGDLKKNSEHESLLTKTLKERIVSSPVLQSGMHLQYIKNITGPVANTKDPQFQQTHQTLENPIAKKNQKVGFKEENQTFDDIYEPVDTGYRISGARLHSRNMIIRSAMVRKMLLDLFDFSILQDRTFIIMCFGVSCSLTSDVVFTSLLPLAMLNRNYTTMDASMAVTVSCMAEFVSKIFLTIFGIFFHVRAKTIFFFAMVAMNAAKLGYFFFDDTLTGIMISVAIIGVVRVLLFVPQPLVVVESYPVDKYAACFSMFALISGVMMTVANPIFGIIKDLTNSFPICQLLLIALNSAFIIPWGLELGIHYRRKNQQNH